MYILLKMEADMTGTTQNLDKTAASRLTRRSLLAGLTATLSAPAIAAPIGPHRTPRSVRRLSLVSIHIGERIETVYRVDDRYLAGAMAEIVERACRRWVERWRRIPKSATRPRRGFSSISGVFGTRTRPSAS